MTENIANLKARDTIKIKSVGKSQNRARTTHRQVTLICPTKVTIKERDTTRRRATIKRTL